MLTPLDAVLLKTARAQEHARELEAEIERLVGPDGDRIVVTDENGEHLHYTARVQGLANSVPDRLALIAGDSIHNYRAALDHLAYQLVIKSGNVPTDRTYFPVVSRPFPERTQRVAVTGGVTEEILSAIDALQPYRAGEGYPHPLTWLHKLDIVDWAATGHSKTAT